VKIVNLVDSPWIRVNRARVIKIMEPIDREIFLSIECGTIDEAERSLAFFGRILDQ